MKESISKAVWLNSIQCLTLGWHGLRVASTAPKESALFRMEQGQQVGALARELFPKGVWVSKIPESSGAEATQKLIADASTETLFEARFVAGPFVARADIITRHGKAWRVLEVKSSFSDTKSMESLIYDLAYTVMVLRRAGLKVTKASLVLLSRNYRYGDKTDLLFDVVDRTADVEVRVAEFERVADSYAKALLADKPPKARLVSICRECPFFADRCLGAGIDWSVLELPNLHHTKFKALSDDGIIDLANLPATLKLTPRQERVRDAALSGKTFVDSTLTDVLGLINWPCHYLDFETVASVLPLYPGHGCHQQVLTQFSIHHRDSLDGEVRHSEYLADATKDCQREVAEALIRALGDGGAIVVYGSFEKTRINGLRDVFADLAGPLQAIVERLVDLCSVISNGVYHPEFHGKFSIKKVLPVLVPELSYADLAIGDGDTAIAQFARMAKGDISDDQTAVTRQQLLEYCKLDTFAMVRLHQKLAEMSAP